MTRLYHVVVINEKNGKKAYMSAYPMPHSEACTMLIKLTRHPWRRNQLEEA